MDFLLAGRTIRLYRWQVAYTGAEGAEQITKTPYESEARRIAEKTQGKVSAIDTSANEWLEGIVVPEDSNRVEQAIKIQAMGKSAWLNSQNIPSAEASIAALARRMLAAAPPETDDEKLGVSGLYANWTAGSYTVGDIRNANGQTWECFQAHDNATYPDINPDNAAWYTFWRPLHGKTPETARTFVPVQGAHDMYRAGEYMVWTDGAIYRCVQDANFSPADYAAAWEMV